MAGGAPYPTGWQNGRLVPSNQVSIPLLAPGVSFAAAVFEGVRGYRQADGTVALFRLPEHLERLVYSARLLGLEDLPDPDMLTQALHRMLSRDAVTEDCYIRLHVHVDGSGDMSAIGPLGVAMVARPRPQLTQRLEQGLRCQVSSWRRIGDNASPPRAKAAANYLNSRLAAIQARADGYDTAILLTESGHVAEGPGSCLFMVRDGVLLTPGVTSGILESITRDTVLRLARASGLFADVIERDIDRTELHAASEVLMVGTGMEITPVVGVDRLAVAEGARGPLTQALQDRYFTLVRGGVTAPAGWLDPITYELET